MHTSIARLQSVRTCRVGLGMATPLATTSVRMLLGSALSLACLASLARAQGTTAPSAPPVKPAVQQAPAQAQAQPSSAWEQSPFAQHGPFVARTLRDTLRDDARGKDLQITLRWPTSTDANAKLGPRPLVVFSHGMGGDREAFTKLSEHWASHGFIVAHATHSDSIKLRREQGEKLTRESMRDVRNVDPADRVADVVFLAQSPQLLLDLIAKHDAGAGKVAQASVLAIDINRIAIAGHSAGALTTQLAINVKARMREPGARARDMLARSERGNEVFKAGVVISGQGTTNRMLGEESWNELRVPMLVLAGSEDVAGVGNETPESRRHPFEKSRGEAAGGPPVGLVWIVGATHGSYQGKDLTNLLREDPAVDVGMVAATTRASTLAFLLAWSEGTLKGMQTPPASPEATWQNAQQAGSLSQAAPRVLRDPAWLPALSEEQATLQWK